MRNRTVIFFDWHIGPRIGGPPGYLWHLRQGLQALGQDKKICWVVQDEVVVPPAVNEKGTALSQEDMDKEAAGFLEFIQNIYDIRMDEDQCRRVGLNSARIIHVHTVIDAIKVHNSLVKKGLRHLVCVALTSHCPEAPSHEVYSQYKSKGVSAPLCDAILNAHRTLDYFAFTVADVFIFPTPEAREPYFATIDGFDTIFRQKPTYFVPTGIVAQTYEDDAVSHYRQQYGAQGVIFSYVGRHNAVKGYDRLCATAQALEDAEVAHKFLIGGVPGEIPAPDLPNWIEIGWTSDPASLIKSSDVFILPNRQTYFDLILLEIISLGVPVVLSYTGGSKTLRDMSPGLLFFETDEELFAICRSIAAMSSEELAFLGEENRKLYESTFNHRRFARDYLIAYNRIAHEFCGQMLPDPNRNENSAREILISVIVPVYNVEQYLGQCLTSIAASTLQDIEVLVVDDGSTDDSRAIAYRHASFDPRFKVIERRNGGLSAARNSGLMAARGRYVMFLDSDDYIAPDMLESLYAACEETGVDLAICGVNLVFDDEASVATDTVLGDEPLFKDAGRLSVHRANLDTASRLYPSAWNKIYRRTRLQQLWYREGMYYEDHSVFHSIMNSIDVFAYVAEPFYHHRLTRAGSITKDGSRRVFTIFPVIDLIFSINSLQIANDQTQFIGAARIAIRLLWERLWAISDDAVLVEFVELARLCLAHYGISRDYAIAIRDSGIPEQDINRLFGLEPEKGAAVANHPPVPEGHSFVLTPADALKHLSQKELAAAIQLDDQAMLALSGQVDSLLLKLEIPDAIVSSQLVIELPSTEDRPDTLKAALFPLSVSDAVAKTCLESETEWEQGLVTSTFPLDKTEEDYLVIPLGIPGRTVKSVALHFRNSPKKKKSSWKLRLGNLYFHEPFSAPPAIETRESQFSLPDLVHSRPHIIAGDPDFSWDLCRMEQGRSLFVHPTVKSPTAVEMMVICPHPIAAITMGLDVPHESSLPIEFRCYAIAADTFEESRVLDVDYMQGISLCKFKTQTVKGGTSLAVSIPLETPANQLRLVFVAEVEGNHDFSHAYFSDIRFSCLC